jgi:hypothetical protein
MIVLHIGSAERTLAKLIDGFAHDRCASKPYALTVEYGVLTYDNKLARKADATLSLAKSTFEQAIEAGDIKVEGRKEAGSIFPAARN